MRELTLELARNRSLQAETERILDQFKRACRADCALVAIPEGENAVRVLAAGLDGMEAIDASLPTINSPQCIEVIETRDVVAIADVGGMPPAEVCSFMRAEDFSGYLGVPIFLEGSDPVAVVAAMSHPPHRWAANEVAHGRAASTALSQALVAAGFSGPEKPN